MRHPSIRSTAFLLVLISPLAARAASATPAPVVTAAQSDVASAPVATPAPAAPPIEAASSTVTTQPPAPAPRELPPLPRPSEGLHFRFTADAWFPRLEGTASNGGAELEFGDADGALSGLGLDDSEVAFDGVGEIRSGPWSVQLSGFDFSTNGSSTATSAFSWGGVFVPAGGAVSSSFDLASVAVEPGFLLWRPLADQPWPWSDVKRNDGNVAPNGDYRADLRFTPIAGARWLGIEQTLESFSTGGEASYDGDWLALYGGLRVELALRIPEEVPFLERIVFGGSAGFGGVVSGGSGTYWQVRAGIEIYPVANVAFTAGYQLIDVDANDGDFEFDGGPQGLWVGMTIAF